MTKSNPKNNYIYAYGRRKSSVASVKLYTGKGDTVVNGKPIDKYFPGADMDTRYLKPFTVTDNLNKYHYTAKIVGGGKTGQLEALLLAISRCLKKIDAVAFNSTLRQAGLLTVDSRVRERRMVGTGGKARRQKQSPKR